MSGKLLEMRDIDKKIIMISWNYFNIKLHYKSNGNLKIYPQLSPHYKSTPGLRIHIVTTRNCLVLKKDTPN